MSPKPIILPYKYKPRPYQVPFFNALQEGYKRFDLVWHRRAGKDLTVINATAMAMADTDNKTGYGGVGSYFYFFPTFAQGKKVIWDGATRDGTRFTDFIPEELRAATWNDEMKIRLKNGSLFQIIGTDSNFDNIMGTNPIWCVFSEYALQNPLAWEYIRPILRENKGRAIFIYTPRGKANHGYTLHYDVAKLNPDTWFSQVLSIDDTKVLTEADMEEERREGMSEELIAQEYYCSFEMGIEGAYYGREIQKLRDEERITKVPIDSAKPVHTAWDIGVTDFTSIIFYQVYPTRYHIVDFYQNMGEGVQHYADILNQKGYVYGNHYGGHDLKARQWVSEGKPTIEVAREYGINFQVVPKLSIQDGIQAGRSLFSKCYFDEEKTHKLLVHLENYTKVWSKAMNCYTSVPKKDGNDHAADAWRYLAVAEKSPYVWGEYADEEHEREIEYISQYSNRYSGL